MYNATCKELIIEKLPLYLENKNGRERQIIARFRCRNEQMDGRGIKNRQMTFAL